MTMFEFDQVLQAQENENNTIHTSTDHQPRTFFSSPSKSQNESVDSLQSSPGSLFRKETTPACCLTAVQD